MLLGGVNFVEDTSRGCRLMVHVSLIAYKDDALRHSTSSDSLIGRIKKG